jgi:lipopolysaccharide/colanic/teichoic acid biosynthesis glycosyltransferase
MLSRIPDKSGTVPQAGAAERGAELEGNPRPTAYRMVGMDAREMAQARAGRASWSAYEFIKRAADIVVAGTGLLLSMPVWLAVCAAILLDDGLPIFYRQRRMGRGGRIFEAVKFRSMIRNAERITGPVWATQNDPRITKVGRVLRKTALDELPQLWNILKGDMSFVGPRPERPELVAQIARSLPGYMRRHAVPPGLTGLAQVYGRYHSRPHQKLKYDLLYARRRGLLLDMEIFLMSWLITFRANWDTTSARSWLRRRRASPTRRRPGSVSDRESAAQPQSR